MKHCKPNSMRPLHLLSPIALAIIATTSPVLLAAEQQEVQQKKPEVITVTGSRIQRTELVSSSPVVSVDEAQIHLDRAVNVEDITAK
jgi:iron complex outermembrane receptor protein